MNSIKIAPKTKDKPKATFLPPSAAHARRLTTPSFSKLHDIPQKKGICVASPVFCNSILRLGHPLPPLYTGVVRTRFLVKTLTSPCILGLASTNGPRLESKPFESCSITRSSYITGQSCSMLDTHIYIKLQVNITDESSLFAIL